VISQKHLFHRAAQLRGLVLPIKKGTSRRFSGAVPVPLIYPTTFP